MENAPRLLPLDKDITRGYCLAGDRRRCIAKAPRVASAEPRRPRKEGRREPAVHRDAGGGSEEKPVSANPASACGGARRTSHRTCREFKEEACDATHQRGVRG